MRTIDHLVYCVPDLYEAMESFSKKCGVEVVYGGQHLTIGTHNALLNLGNEIYLEFLAIDPTNEVKAPRWMGMDLIDKSTFTRWALKTDDLAKDVAILKKANPEMGQIFEGSRKKTDGSTLRWAMALPLAKPEVEILPFMVNWKDSVHPTKSLAEGCQLIKLEAMHPNPSSVLPTLAALGVEIEVKQGFTASLTAIVQTPKGTLVL